jgi:hypothetical protein
MSYVDPARYDATEGSAKRSPGVDVTGWVAARMVEVVEDDFELCAERGLDRLGE